MSDFGRLDRLLLDAARTGANPLALDMPEERDMALNHLKVMRDDLIAEGSYCCNVKIIERAISEIEKSRESNVALFVRPIFTDVSVPDFGCWPLCLDDPLFQFMIPLEQRAFASFRVYTGGRDKEWHDVTITKPQWNFITEPIVKKKQKMDLSAPLVHEQRIGLFDAIGETVGRFEKIVGPKAGTSGDIGGMRGNYHLQVRNSSGQQDCHNESLTTRQLIAALNSSGLLGPFKFEYNHSISMYRIGGREMVVAGGGILHMGVRIVDDQRMEIVVDSWFEKNGEPAAVLPYDEWQSYYKQQVSQRR